MTTTNRRFDTSDFFNYDIFSEECDEEEEEDEESVDFLLPDDAYDTDHESVEEEEPSYLQQLPLVEALDFFEELGVVPSIDDLSPDGTPTISEMSEGFDVQPSTDAEHIDNPPTEAEVGLLQSKMSLALQIPQTESVQGEPSDTTEEEFEDLEDLALPDEAFEESKSMIKIQEADDALEMFLGLETHEEVVVIEEIDWQLIAKQEAAQIMQESALAFINDLINQVVEIVESKTPQEILRQNLDKRKLLEHLWKDYQNNHVEKTITFFLNRKIIEFYKRKKTLRPILPDKLKNLSMEMSKHKCAIERLDKLLGDEETKSQIRVNRTNELKQELRDAAAEAHAEIQLFEIMVKEALIKDSRPKLSAILENMLNVMARYRRQISRVRFELFIKQDTLATLMEAHHKMEDLGNGLTLKNFSTLQTETFGLEKKLEERNVELNKLHIRMRDDIHQNSHYKEKQKMLRNTLAVQRMALEELYEEKTEWREKIHLLKIKRLQIRSEIKDLSFKGGLVDKPALLYDYDRTCEKIERRQEINNNLRGKQQELQKQIDALMGHSSSSMRLS